MTETTTHFKALWVAENEDGRFIKSVKQVPFEALPENDVLIRVHFSSLNYKDALSASGNKEVTKHYPFIPGIDAAGTVIEDRSGTYKKGEEVIVTSYDLGMNTFGGFGEYIRVPAEWVIPRPGTLSLFNSMVYGTAGYTAAYGVLRLERELITPESGPVLVTGATGGVGSMAVFLLAQAGYHVIAVTGKPDKNDELKELGASEILDRNSFYPEKEQLLGPGMFAAAIDTVGGKMLEVLIPRIKHNGAVACCGNILGHRLQTNIYPFILRGVSLLGIDSGITLRETRLQIWKKIAAVTAAYPQKWIKEVTLEELPHEIDLILEGRQSGRVVLSHAAGG